VEEKSLYLYINEVSFEKGRTHIWYGLTYRYSNEHGGVSHKMIANFDQSYPREFILAFANATAIGLGIKAFSVINGHSVGIRLKPMEVDNLPSFQEIENSELLKPWEFSLPNPPSETEQLLKKTLAWLADCTEIDSKTLLRIIKARLEKEKGEGN